MIAIPFDFLNVFKKSPLLAFIKFKPTFLTGSLAVLSEAALPAISYLVEGERFARD